MSSERAFPDPRSDEDRVASRLDHWIWPDGSITPGRPIKTYAQACALYERTRRVARWPDYIALARASDGLGYEVRGIPTDHVVRHTPGNVYPHPGAVEYHARNLPAPQDLSARGFPRW